MTKTKELRREWDRLYGDDFEGGCRDRYFDWIESKLEAQRREIRRALGKAYRIGQKRMVEIRDEGIYLEKDSFYKSEFKKLKSKFLKSEDDTGE